MTQMLELVADSSRQAPEQLGHQGDLVIQGFRSLVIQWDSYSVWLPGRTSIEERAGMSSVMSKEDLLSSLQSSILLILQRQILSLSLALMPSHLQKEPGKNLKLLLQSQSALDHSLRQIECIIDILCPQHLGIPNRTDDQHLKALKSFRLYGLKSKFSKLLSQELLNIFRKAPELIQQLNLSTDQNPINQTDDPTCHPSGFSAERTLISLAEHTLPALDMAESMVDWLKGSDLDLAQEYWNFKLVTLDELVRLCKEMCVVMGNEKSAGNQLVREPVIRLARLVIPIIKLSRLFLYKLSRRGINQRRLCLLYSEMSSDQIESLSQAAGNITRDLLQLLILFTRADTAYGAVSSQQFTEKAQTLKDSFENPLLLSILYILPLIPETDGSPTQDSYRDWLVTWNTLRILAIHNFINCAKSFENDH
ncbi:hypothetical protein PGT21_025512 [Puccinia graminis f. sp. tritici]|uniref:Uncharacterized protein n=1 Tax=Puccinia graminis f. sp. tritici TaxID=56615 RepID=A0A5B0R7I2_PUCGR|nr:hypothetical protein PGT21_025512 [Puccinia graminis f. sp. tritici]KAA1120945.1 hypothetical protein PGTUg99_021545 [Puccinia graminis f. sp. tritici]